MYGNLNFYYAKSIMLPSKYTKQSTFVSVIAWFGRLFKKNSPSNYSKRKIGPSPKDEGLFSFE